MFGINKFIKFFLIIICIAVIPAVGAAQPAEHVPKEPVSLAVIPGAGERQPSDLVIANLEVHLSSLPDVSLVERSLINKVLQEIHLGESGLQDKKQAVTIGQLVAADILVFVKKGRPSLEHKEQITSGTDTDIVLIRLMETRTGIILGSLLEDAERLESDLPSILSHVQTAINKEKIPLENRKHIGILAIKNNEPGTSLDGAAEALQMFLAIDLPKAPNVIMLDRDHLQYLQTERALTGMNLKLKHSTFVVEGGLQYEEGRQQIIVSVVLRSFSGTNSASEKMTFTVDKDDLPKAREVIAQGILQKLDVEKTPGQSPAADKEGELFLMQVPLYLSSGDLEAAVRYAEVAYALLSNQEARYWAARAWYALGWDLVDKSMGDSFRSSASAVRRTRTLGDQFSPGGTQVVPLRRPGEAGRAERFQSGNSNIVRTTEQRPGQQIEFWGDGRQVRQPADSSRPTAARIEKPRRLEGREHNSSGATSSGQGRDQDASQKDQRIRFLSALIRSYTLMEEMLAVHIRDYESDTQKNIVLPDPRDDFENVSRPEDRQRNLALKYRIGRDDTDVFWLFKQLVQIRNNLNEQQRDFYLQHYTESLKAQTAYWLSWKDKTEMIKQYYRYDPKLSAQIIQQVVDAFMKTSDGPPAPRLKGFIDMLALGRGRALSPEEEYVYRKFTTHEDVFVRFASQKQLMRADPVAYAQKALNIFIQEFPYDHPYRTLDNVSLLPDFVKPVFHRAALSHRQEMLLLAEKLFEPMIRNQDMVQLVAWRDCFWPYVNGLELDGKKEEAQRLVQQVSKILEQKQYFNFSNEAKRLRAELDLKLVQLGAKQSPNTELERYFSFQERPHYIRLRPELEAPRLNDPPIDVSSFSPIQLPTKGLNTTTSSRTRDVVKNGFSGSSFAKGYTRVIDAEGNETYTIMDMDIQREKTKKKGAWQQYSTRRMPVRLVATQQMDIRGNPLQERILQKNYWIDHDKVYILQQSRSNDALLITAFEQSLQNNQNNRCLGEVSVPLGHIKEYFPYYVSAMTTGPEALYVGTAGGLIVFPKKGGKIFQNTSQFSSLHRRYEPYYPDKKENTSPPNASGQAKLLTEKDGLPDNKILSLAYCQGKLYMGLGPLAETQMGLVGNCGFAAYDPETGSYELIASSRSMEKRNALEQGDSYQITTILGDEKRNCLWLGLSGNPDYNGIWRYDMETGRLKRILKEDFSLQDMRWAGSKILYLMTQTGIVQFDPDTSTRTWLLGQIGSALSGLQGPHPPKNFSGQPLCGHPETRLWPFAMRDDDLFTVSWDGYDVLLHRKGQEAVGKSVFDQRATAVEFKAFIDANDEGVWLITQYGNVYLIQ